MSFWDSFEPPPKPEPPKKEIKQSPAMNLLVGECFSCGATSDNIMFGECEDCAGE